MNSDPDSLQRMLDLARRGWPPPASPEEAPSAEAIAFLTRQSFTAATRAVRAADPWLAWERVGRWSFASAAAVVLLVATLHPTPPSFDNPFEPFTTDVPADESEFSPRL